jgi:hypothetical protein
MDYEGMDPDVYRDELIAMGASDEDAKAAVDELQERLK